MYGKQKCAFFTHTKTFTVNWRSTDDQVGMRAPGLDSDGHLECRSIRRLKPKK